MKFSDIPGHEAVKRRLTSLVDTGHMPHALLLQGPEGTAKYALARALAQYIHCENRKNGDSCGTCPACRKHESFNHIDVYYSFPVVKRASGGATISDDYIEDFRKFISESPYMDFERWLVYLDNVNAQPKIYVDEAAHLMERLNFTSRSSQYKIVIIWLPERFQPDTANKMLKVIEEPMDDTLFLLTSNEPGEILPTIYSRCQRVNVPPYTEEDLREVLAGQGVEKQVALAAARLASGNINRAIALAQSDDSTNEEFLEYFMTLMRKAYQRAVADLRQWSTDIAALGREQLINFFEYCSHMLRQNFMLTTGNADLTMLTQAEQAFCQRFSPFINERNVLKLFEVFNKAAIDVAGNVNPKIVTFDLAVKVILLIKK